MYGTYHVVELDRKKLIEACSDAEIYSWKELGRRGSFHPNTLQNAFRAQNGRVSIETAGRIANVLKTKITAFGTIIVCNAGESVGKEFVEAKKRKSNKETAKETAEPVKDEPAKKEPDKPAGNTTLQLQLLLKEQKTTNALLQRLVEIWEK